MGGMEVMSRCISLAQEQIKNQDISCIMVLSLAVINNYNGF